MYGVYACMAMCVCCTTASVQCMRVRMSVCHFIHRQIYVFVAFVVVVVSFFRWVSCVSSPSLRHSIQFSSVEFFHFIFIGPVSCTWTIGKGASRNKTNDIDISDCARGGYVFAIIRTHIQNTEKFAHILYNTFFIVFEVHTQWVNRAIREWMCVCISLLFILFFFHVEITRERESERLLHSHSYVGKFIGSGCCG